MQSLQLKNGRVIGSRNPVYIVAELNTSHFGNTEVACKMIDAVKEAGADCVKFQSWSEHSLYSENFYRDNPMAKRFMTKFALGNHELKHLRDYAKENGLDFASTPYSREEAEYLVKQCEVPFIKIASMDLNNLTFLVDIAQLEVPIFLSTGMGELEEIRTALEAINSCGNSQIVILHCVSLYPTPDYLVNLNNIYGFRSEFKNVIIGYSDHSMGSLASQAAVAMGCSVIEKHVTLDSKKIGFDNQMAMEFLEFRSMVQEIRRLEQMLGTTDRNLSSVEAQKSLEMRRSIVAKRDITQGEALTLDSINFKRPGTGIPLNQLNSVLGKTARRNLPKDFLLEWDDLI
jgi:sialic acid synthase SpsE